MSGRLFSLRGDIDVNLDAKLPSAPLSPLADHGAPTGSRSRERSRQQRSPGPAVDKHQER